jgi:5-methylcytosine-specific restriction endonuclease McrA
VAAFHHSPRWRGLRLQALRRDGWRCVRCAARGRLEVDHRQPRERRPDLAWALDNLQTLCRACHIDKTKSESRDGLSEQKKQWLQAIDALMRR